MEFRPILSALARNPVGAVLIALQIAITLSIVTNAVFIMQQRAADMARPSGMDEANSGFIVVTPFDPNADKESQIREDLQNLRSLSGVRAATMSLSLPMIGSGNGRTLITNPETNFGSGAGFREFFRG